LSGIETLNANSLAFTSTVSQFQGITTFTNASAVTFTDAGTITGKAGVTSHTLADGTNTVTTYGAAASDQSVLGGSGADTINISSTYLTVGDTITGGTGADTVNVTGNTASANTTWIDAISGVETITFANTTTNVSITPVNGVVAANATVTIDTTAMTSGILTFSGANEADGKYVISAGAGADVITGSAGADSIYGGFGGDSITGGAGADTIDLGSGDGAVDTVVLATTTNDLIYSYSITGGDIIKFIDGGGDLVGTATKGFAKGLGTALGLGATAMDAANVIVITDAQTQTGTGIQAVIATINGGAGANIGDGVYIISAAANGNANVWYDAAAANTDSVQVGTLVGIVLADLANLVTANFAVA